MGGVGWVACQGFLVREACVGVLVGGGGFLLSGVHFIFLGSKITADGNYSHEIKRHLLLGRKVMTNLDSIFKSRDITLSTKFHWSRLWFFQRSCMDVRVGL